MHLIFSQISSAFPVRWQSPDAVLPKEVSESMQPFFKFVAAAIETFASSASAPDISSHAFRYRSNCFSQNMAVSSTERESNLAL